MGFIEILFMATLGALFVLLALLIYHYKRQLNKLESKYDTMFEIINSLVKEVYQCKSDITEYKVERTNQGQIQNVPYTPMPSYLLDQLMSGLPLSSSGLPVSNTDSNDSETEEEDTESDIESDEESVEEQPEREYRQIYMAVNEEREVQPEYKTIFITAEPEPDINVSLADLGVEELDSRPVEPTPQVAVEEENDHDDLVSVLTSERRKPYSKMNLQELKQEVQFLGITTDVSKMKKPEIAQLLRNHKQGESS